jgi:hypothetical protein
MEKVLVWDSVRNRIPDGVYYNRKSIPYKYDRYEVIIDCGYVQERIFVYVNGEEFTGLTDNSGVYRLFVRLKLGVNKFKYRVVNQIGWKEFEIEVTNEAVLSHGIAEAGRVELETVKGVMYDNFSETAVDMTRFKHVLDYDKISDKYKYGEALEAYKQWIDRYRAVRLLGNVEWNGVTGFVGKTRSWICNANLIKGWQYNRLEGFSLDKKFYNLIVNRMNDNLIFNKNKNLVLVVEENESLSIVENVDFFRKVLQYNGDGISRIFAECSYYDMELVSDWVVEVYLRSNIKISNRVKIGIGYTKENRFTTISVPLVDNNWRRYVIQLSEDKVPDVAVIELFGINKEGLINNEEFSGFSSFVFSEQGKIIFIDIPELIPYPQGSWLQIGSWRVRRGRWKNTTSLYIGSFRPVKSVGMYVGVEEGIENIDRENIKIMGDVVERVLPVWVKNYKKLGKVFGYWDDGLKYCNMYNCYYDEDKRAVVNKQIYKYNVPLEYASFNMARFGWLATQRFGILRKDGEVIVKDDGSLVDMVSWDWVSADTIKINHDYFELIDKWDFSFEAYTAVVSGVIEISPVLLGSEYDVIVDGLVEYGISGLIKYRQITENIVFDKNGVGKLKNKAVIKKGIDVVDIKSGNVIQVEFSDNETIQITDNNKVDRGIVSYYVEGFKLDRDYKVWWKGSNSLSGFGDIEWEQVNFLDSVKKRIYNQLKVELFGDKEKEFYRVKGLYLRVIKEVEV